MSLYKKHPLIVFILIAFLIATPLFILATAEQPAINVFILLFVGSYAPAISAWITTLVTREINFRLLIQFYGFLWKVNIRWYLAAILIPSSAWIVVALIKAMLFTNQATQWAALLAFPVIFIFNWGEELGWRGFALPMLMKTYSPMKSSIVLGVIWGCFHIGLYWQRPLFALIFIGLAIAMSIIITWLYLQTSGSVIICAFFHAVFNSWSQAILPASGSESLLLIITVLLFATALFLVLRYKQVFQFTKAKLITEKI